MACRDEEGASCSAVAPSLHKLCKLEAADSNGAEWRSWEQLEASPASTSPPWDSGDDDSSGSCVSGSRPSDLYGKFTWKIEKFSQISKRELRSSVFEVGGYRWYILVYPQGCDVCNHLSLFLCVADYDKLLPGWTHFAQFTIAVVNKDPKKSKYSDTLHRFCKKEHDWGWKKFMELSKVLDGFTVADTLVIKAQVQVIRENPHRPFRCLDCQYRRELIRVYLTNVEGICRRFMEEKREKIGKLMEDPVRWSSFRAFWSSVEENVRRRLSREKIEVILKALVKTFFNEKEVTSTLVMDALYSGCKVLDYCGKNKKGRINGVVVEEAANPVIQVDKETFVLAGDVLTLLERIANESLPPYKDDKAPQNRAKDCSSGDDFGKDTVERDERRLTELGRRTVEMFVLAHLFSNRVEVAYLEAIALRRQEELIREEEAAGQAEIELKARREAAEKEKRTKKKQAKQRRNKCKDKDKELDQKRSAIAHLQELQCREGSASIRDSDVSVLKGAVVSNADIGEEDDDSSVLDTTDGIVGTLRPAVDDGDADNAMWEREGFETHYMMEASFSGGSGLDSVQNGRLGHQIILDDSSSTCSSDSIPPINGAFNGSSRRRSNMTDQRHISANRGRFRVTGAYEKESRYVDTDGTPWSRLGTVATAEPSCTSGDLDAETIIISLKKRVQWLQQCLQEKEAEVVSLHGQLSLYKHKYASDPEKKCDSTVCHQRLGAAERESQDASQTQRNIEAEMQTTGRATGKDAAVVSGSSSVSMSSLVTDLKDPAVSQPQTVGTCDVPEVRSSSAASAQLSCSLDSSVASPIGDTAETNHSRPSSAPDVAGVLKANFSSTQQLHPPAPHLARSASATGRLGTTSSEPTMISPAAQQASSVTPSARNTAAGVIQGNSSIASLSPFVAAPPACGGIRPYVNTPYTNGGTPNGISHPMAGGPGFRDSPASLTSYSQSIPSVCAPQTAHGANAITGTEGVPAEGVSALESENKRPGQSRSNMGFTFGTLTPEILRLQHQQEQGHHYTNSTPLQMQLQSQTHTFYREQRQLDERQNGPLQSPIQHRSKSSAHCLDFMKTCNDVLHNGIDQAARIRQAAHTCAEVSTSGVVMSEFPHLDIINELLDDDKMLNAKALNAFLQQPGIQSLPRHLSYHDIHRICSGQFPVEISVLAEGLDKSDRGLHCDDTLRIPFPRDSIQLLHPATHPHLPRSFSHHNCSVNGMVGHQWPGAPNDFPIHSCMNGMQNGLDVLMGYPLQSPHLPFGDCPVFAVGQNGHPMYSPIKHP